MDWMAVLLEVLPRRLVCSARRQLPAAGDQGVELRLILRAFFGQPRRGELGKLRQHPRINGVGFGQDAKANGQVTDLSGIDQRHRQFRVN